MKYFLRIVLCRTVLLFLFSIRVEGHGSSSWQFNALHTKGHDDEAGHVTLTCRYVNDDNDDNDDTNYNTNDTNYNTNDTSNNTNDTSNNTNDTNDTNYNTKDTNYYTDDTTSTATTTTTTTTNNNNNTQIRMKEVTLISILKLDKDPNNQWVTYANVYRTGRPALLAQSGGDGVTVHGLVGQVDQAYLSVRWEKTTLDTLGIYMCQVEGYTDLDTHIISNTQTVTLGMPALDWKAALNLFFENKKTLAELQRESKSLQRRIDALHRKSEEIHSLGVSLMMTYANRHGYATHWDPPPTTKWPEGRFALLKPETGCPNSTNGEMWLDGYIRFHTESTWGKYPNDDSVSEPSHMAKPVRERKRYSNFFHMHTCRQDNPRVDNAKDWPKGSYCVLDNAGQLLNFFRVGKVYLDTEKDYPRFNDRAKNSPHLDRTDGGMYLYFQCRKDGNPRIPIELPVQIPFYLFRRGDTCQEVRYAKVTSESFTIDTDDESLADRTYLDVPDVSLNPVHFHTCYYQPVV